MVSQTIENAGDTPQHGVTGETLSERVQKFDGNTATDEIVAMLRDMGAAVAIGQIKKGEAAELVGVVAEKTGLPANALKEDLRVVRRVSTLNQGDDAAIQIAYVVLGEHFAYGCTLWHDPDGALWKFEGRHWVAISKERIKQVVAETCLSSPNLSSLYTRKSSKAAVELMLTLCLRSVPLSHIASGYNLLLNVGNGELWLGDDAIMLRPHRPWAGQTAVSDITYTPDAKSPKYDAALAEIFSKASDPADMIRHWHEFAGYAIQPRRPIPTFWLLIGKGANGKSKLLDIIRKIVGPQGVLSEPISRFQNDRFALSSLEGRKLLIDDDVDEDLILGDGLIKKLSEEKAVTARRPYGRMKKEFISIALPVMAGNHYPTTKDISTGMQRRTFVIPFDRVFGPDEQQPDLFEHIWQNERSGVLNEVLAGLTRVVKRGFKFDQPQDCLEARQKFFVESNPLRAFIAEQCNAASSVKTRLTFIRAAFRSWAQENAIPASTLGGNKLRRNLELLGFEITKVKGYPYVHGLKLKNEKQFA
jgi:putative DNA primase/helicase